MALRFQWRDEHGEALTVDDGAQSLKSNAASFDPSKHYSKEEYANLVRSLRIPVEFYDNSDCGISLARDDLVDGRIPSRSGHIESFVHPDGSHAENNIDVKMSEWSLTIAGRFFEGKFIDGVFQRVDYERTPGSIRFRKLVMECKGLESYKQKKEAVEEKLEKLEDQYNAKRKKYAEKVSKYAVTDAQATKYKQKLENLEKRYNAKRKKYAEKVRKYSGDRCKSNYIRSATCVEWNATAAKAPLHFTRHGSFSVIVEDRVFDANGKLVERYTRKNLFSEKKGQNSSEYRMSRTSLY
jgi:hypothetical protein